MLENLLSIPLTIIYALLFGTTMKIADLLDEHGLKWFKGSKILFGFLWGIFGGLLILSNPIIANIYLALVLAFILRYRIDYLNHGIAATIMIFVFLLTQIVNWEVLLFFFSVFAIFGLATDYFENKKYPKNSLLKFCRKFVDLRAQYYLFPFLYSIYTGFWLAFFVVGLNMLFYEITLRFAKRKMKIKK